MVDASEFIYGIYISISIYLSIDACQVIWLCDLFCHSVGILVAGTHFAVV